MNKNEYEIIRIDPDNMEITAEEAVKIANSNKCLKDSIFLSELKNNIRYGYIAFKKFAVKKVTFHEVTEVDEMGRKYYIPKDAWYVKVINGDYGYTIFEKDSETEEIIEIEDCDGCFDEKSNISCLIFIEDGEYMFLTEDLEKEIYDFEE